MNSHVRAIILSITLIAPYLARSATPPVSVTAQPDYTAGALVASVTKLQERFQIVTIIDVQGRRYDVIKVAELNGNVSLTTRDAEKRLLVVVLSPRLIFSLEAILPKLENK